MARDPGAGSHESRAGGDRLLAGVVVVLSAAFLTLLAVEFRHDFDVTDEAFSLLDAAHPQDQTSAVRFHWLVTRPLLLLSFGDLWLNRIAGLILLASAGWMAGARFDRTRGSSSRGGQVLAGAVGSACMLAFYAFDRRSPNYNWAAVLGACLVVGCLAGAAGSARAARWLAVGGAVAAITAASKVSTGTALAAMGVVLAGFVAGPGWRGFLHGLGSWTLGVVVAGVASFLVLRWWGDPIAAFERGAQVLEHIRLYDDLAGRTLKESLEFLKFWFEGAWPLLASAAVLGSAGAILSRRLPATATAVVPWAFPLTAGVLLLHTPEAWSKFDVWARVSLGAFTILAATWLSVGGTSLRSGTLDRRGHATRAIVLLAAVAAPFATAVGTGNAMYWRSAGLASGVWLLAASALALGVGAGRRVNSSAQLASIAAASIIAFSTFSAMRAQPYRPLAGEAETPRACEISPGRGELIVDGRLASAIERLRDEASRAGFTPGQDVLALYDMPGVVLALGGRAPGASWILSGYHGCGPAAEVVLGSVAPDRRARAWVMLRSPQRAETWKRAGANPDVREVLGAVGLDFPSGYERVAEVAFPFYDQTATVSLWKPTGSTLGSP
jgi:hypothetical protein